jgi:repressor LexA
MKLTPKQSEVLSFIQSFISIKGLPPTRKELAAHFGWKSPSAADDYLRRLAMKGVIHLWPNTARGIKVLESA